MQEGNTSSNNFYEEYAATIEVKETKSLNDNYYTYMKRVGDIIFSVLCLPIACLIISICSIIIKLESPGPAFFIQERVGLNGKYFKVFKLRSMYTDAEENGAVWAEKDDPRVTKVGKFIRKTRIDEVPQLFNVLKGDMSLIGPRPERPIFTAEFEQKYPGFTRRLSVKPGVTGWAQVNGGYDVTPKEKLALDLYYIENKTALLDLKILLKTIKVILTGEGAR